MGNYSSRFALSVVLSAAAIGSCGKGSTVLDDLRKELSVTTEAASKTGSNMASVAATTQGIRGSVEQVDSVVNSVQSLSSSTGQASNLNASLGNEADSGIRGGVRGGIRGGIRGVAARRGAARPRRQAVDAYSCPGLGGFSTGLNGSVQAPAPVVGTYDCFGDGTVKVEISDKSNGLYHVKITDQVKDGYVNSVVEEYDISPKGSETCHVEEIPATPPANCSQLTKTVTECVPNEGYPCDAAIDFNGCKNTDFRTCEETTKSTLYTCKDEMPCDPAWDYNGCQSDTFRTCAQTASAPKRHHGGPCGDHFDSGTCTASPECCWDYGTYQCKYSGQCGGGCNANNYCDPGETAAMCPNDNCFTCPNSICESTKNPPETSSNCSQDCGGGSCSTFVTEPTCPTSTCCWETSTNTCKTTGTCSGGGCTTTPAGATSEFWTGIYYCSDGINNDCDGMTDCSDPDCAGASNCAGGGSCSTFVTQPTCPTSTCCWETSTNMCKNSGQCGGGCTPNPAGTTNEAGFCYDGINNDCDAYQDAADPDCGGGGGCTTTPAGATSEFWTGIYYCSDGINNDCDGMTDCSDPDCAGASNCAGGGSCSTFVTQPTCPTSTCCWETSTNMCKNSGQCGGGGCNYNMACEGGESYPSCSDCPYMPPPPSCNYNTVCEAGEDNYNCPGDCPPGTSGGPPPGGGYELCYDGFDNEGDGMVDCADPDCGFDPACATSGGCNYNAVCEASENAFSCPDCAGGAIGCNMNGACDGGESSYSCPSDCAAGGMGKAPYTCSFSYSCDDSAGACYAAAVPGGPGGGGSCATPPPGVTCTKEAAKAIVVCKDRIACTPSAAPPPPAAGPGGFAPPPPPGATCASDACQTCSTVTRTVYECTDCLAGGFAPGAPVPPPPAGPGANPAERRQAAGPAGQYCVTYQWQPPATDMLSNCTLSGSTYVCKRCMSDPWTPIGGFANVSQEVLYADGSSEKAKTFLFEGKRLVSRAFKVDEIAALIAAAKKGDSTTLESSNFLKSDALAITVVSVEVSTLTAAANKAARRQEASTTGTPSLASAFLTGQTTVSVSSETNLAAARGVSKKETSAADFTLLAYSDGAKGFEIRSFAGKADLPCPLGAGGANVNTNEKFAGTFLEQFPGSGSTTGTFEYCAVDKAGDPNSNTDDSGAWYHKESGTSTFSELAGAQSEYAVKETQTNVMQGIWTNDLASTDTILRDCGENVTGREEVVTTFKNPSSGELSDEKEAGEFATDAKTCNVLPKAVEGSVFASVQNLKMGGGGGKASGEIPLPGGKIAFEITGADSNSPRVKFETTFDAFGISMSAKADISIHPPDAKGNTGEGTLDVKAGDETLKVDLAMDKKGWNTVVGSTTDSDGNTLAFKQTRTDAGSTLDMTLTYPDGKQDTGTIAFTKEPNSAKEVGSGTLNAAKPDGTKEDLAMVFCSNGQVAIYDQEGEKRGGLLSGPESCK